MHHTKDIKYYCTVDTRQMFVGLLQAAEDNGYVSPYGRSKPTNTASIRNFVPGFAVAVNTRAKTIVDHYDSSYFTPGRNYYRKEASEMLEFLRKQTSSRERIVSEFKRSWDTKPKLRKSIWEVMSPYETRPVKTYVSKEVLKDYWKFDPDNNALRLPKKLKPRWVQWLKKIL